MIGLGVDVSKSLVLLGEVRAHITLKVEVGELVTLLDLKKARKLLIRVDLATVRRILKGMLANIGVDLASDLSAGHHGTLLTAEESCELVADKRGLDEATRRTVAGLALALGTLLASLLKLTRISLLEVTELRL